MEEIIQTVDYDFFGLTKAINALCSEYPFLKQCVIGQSTLGRNIPALVIGQAKEYVLFAAAFHGSERITATLTLRFLENLCKAIKSGNTFLGFYPDRVLKQRGLVVVPIVNPDGLEIAINGACSAGKQKDFIEKISKGDTAHYNANARGVDINHNFPAGWNELHKKEQQSGIYGPAKTRFGGDKPASESETVALMNLCNKVHFHHALAFHSQGEVIYHNFDNENPKGNSLMAELLSGASGYKLEEPTGLAVGGGFKDWFIKAFHRPAFTIEVGLGKNPLPIEDLDNIYKKTAEMMLIAVMM